MLKQKIIYQLDAGAYKPVKAHEADAGFDLFAREDVALSPLAVVELRCNERRDERFKKVSIMEGEQNGNFTSDKQRLTIR